MSDTEDIGILNIEVSDAEDTPAEKKAKRTGQSEEEFQAVRQTYATRVQNGNLPLRSDASKMDVQELLHAVEELYFFRRYREAADLAAEVLSGGGGSGAALDADSRQLLEKYEAKCRAKQEASGVRLAQ
ncbi:hypothetical protein V2A60_009661 [Cordyceps javanica]